MRASGKKKTHVQPDSAAAKASRAAFFIRECEYTQFAVDRRSFYLIFSSCGFIEAVCGFIAAAVFWLLRRHLPGFSTRACGPGLTFQASRYAPLPDREMADHIFGGRGGALRFFSRENRLSENR